MIYSCLEIDASAICYIKTVLCIQQFCHNLEAKTGRTMKLLESKESSPTIHVYSSVYI